jgi:hypothetical protein
MLEVSSAFDSEDADVSFFQAHDQMHDRRPAEIDSGEIEHHRLPDEKSGRARQRRIYFGQPLDDRHDRSKNKRDVGASSQANQLACGLGVSVHGDRLSLSY